MTWWGRAGSSPSGLFYKTVPLRRTLHSGSSSLPKMCTFNIFTLGFGISACRLWEDKIMQIIACRSFGTFIFNCLRNHHTVVRTGSLNLCSYQQCTEVPISSHPCPLCLLWFFGNTHPTCCAVMPHSSFDFHFFDT